MKQDNTVVKFIVVDLFCGAGGTTSGFSWAKKNGKEIAKVVACVNHDPLAIRSHTENYPDCVHFIEDVRLIDFQALVAVVAAALAKYPNAKLILWASLECTHFSGAKTGSRDADSRTLAECLHEYIRHLNPHFVMIENVREFQSWGPLTARIVKPKGDVGYHCPLTFDKKSNRLNGVFIPENKKKGIDYIKWRQKIEASGYRYNSKLINSADHGAYQSRLRYFAVFAKKGLPVVFPAPTHDKKGRNGLPKWKAVRDVLDLDEVGESIFGRKKPYSENTLRRVLSGLLKFVANGETNYVVKNYGGDPNSKVISIHQPSGTITTIPHESLVTAKFMLRSNGGNPIDRVTSVENPCNTITTSPNQSLVSTDYFIQYNGKPGNSVFPDSGPSHTLTTKDRFGFVRPVFIDNQFGFGGDARGASSLDEPSGTLTTVNKRSILWIDHANRNGQPTGVSVPAKTLVTAPRQSVVGAIFMDRQFGNSSPTSIDKPCGALTTEPKTNLVHILVPTNYGNQPISIDQPHPVITANRKYTYLLNPQFNSAGSDVDAPCFTLIAKMDKRPPHIINAVSGQNSSPDISFSAGLLDHPEFGKMAFYKDENVPAIDRIKVFMALNGIRDIYMKMLNIPELKRIQGLETRNGNEYKLAGPKDQQKKFIGNSVVPVVVTHWIEAYWEEMHGNPVREQLKLIA